MNIGQRIKEMREKIGMTQDELAHKLGYNHRSAINKIESNGEAMRPEKIERIAQALGCDPAYLTGWSNEIKTENNNGGVIGVNASQTNITNFYSSDKDAAELLEIFTHLEPKGRVQLLARAYELEEKYRKKKEK